MSSPTVPAPAAPVPVPVPNHWQALPTRARALFVLTWSPLPALLLGAAGFAVGTLVGGAAAWALPVIGALAGATFGGWLGHKQYRHTGWRLDGDGLALRRGRMWQREVCVPATRVQHLDLKRGPLQRRRGLATLVVHTAGSRHSSVTVPHLDAVDAEHLRDCLARPAGLDDDADGD